MAPFSRKYGNFAEESGDDELFCMHLAFIQDTTIILWHMLSFTFCPQNQYTLYAFLIPLHNDDIGHVIIVIIVVVVSTCT